MNRIILIGNGFDLAHGMKTSYRDFIDDYWGKCLKNLQELSMNSGFENDEISIGQRGFSQFKSNKFNDLKTTLESNKVKIEFKNRFFEIISESSSIQNWIDIENEYYNLLKKSLKGSSYTVKELNVDFQKVKILLVDYLLEIETNFKKPENYKDIIASIGQKIYHPFNLNDFSEISLTEKAEFEYELIKKDIEAIEKQKITVDELSHKRQRLINKIDTINPLTGLKKILQSEEAKYYFDLIPDYTLFLNFNYTYTESSYNNPRNFDVYNDDKFTIINSIHIHGSSMEADNNPVIFGFGDELDDDYKSIEKLNDNDFLENIKSINYLETDNYKKLLEYINSDIFQVFIFGHSCGISDRTLLNTVFEHENCASVKPFYHQISEDTDNYSDIVRNISRNFNDKAKMRDRVVNKKQCEKLV